MTTPLQTRKILFQQGVTGTLVNHPAEDVRLGSGGGWLHEGSDAIKVRSGVVWGPGASAGVRPCAVTAGTSQLTIAPGRFVIQGSTALQGHYEGVIDQAVTRTAAQGGGLPGAGQFKAGRLIIRAYDQLYGDAFDGWKVEMLLGAAAATVGAAALPAVPANSFSVRTFTIDSAGAITLVAGGTPYTVARGTALPVDDMAGRLALSSTMLIPGFRVLELASGRTWEWQAVGTTPWDLVAGPKPMFWGDLATTFSIPPNVWSDIYMDGEFLDTEGGHSLTSTSSHPDNRDYVLPFTGYYRLSGLVTFALSGMADNVVGGRGVHFTKRTAGGVETTVPMSGRYGQGNIWLVEAQRCEGRWFFLAGDMVRMQGWQNAVASLAINGLAAGVDDVITGMQVTFDGA